MQDAMDHPNSPDSGRTETQTKAPNGLTPTTQTASPSSSSTPDDLGSFDWEEFEARYKKALEEADGQELGILKEFDAIARYFNVWARASSEHDDERAVKRLHTRQRFVAQSEERMAQKQQHYVDVLEAFKNAFALLKDQ